MEFLKNYSFLNSEDIDDLQSDETFQEILTVFEEELDFIERQNPACKLWVQYCRTISILRDFIYAEKSED